MNPVTDEPPFDDGVVHVTVAVVLLADTEAEPIVGLLGVVAGVTELDEDEYEEFPTAFVARTWKVYDVPYVRLGNVTDVLAELTVIVLLSLALTV